MGPFTAKAVQRLFQLPLGAKGAFLFGPETIAGNQLENSRMAETVTS